MRSSGRLRSRPVRSVSRQSSASTVPMPVRIASERWRTCWTWARATWLVIQPWLSSGAEIFPSKVTAAFRVTSGRPVPHEMHKGLVEPLGLLRVLGGHLDGQARLTQTPQPHAGDQRVGVRHGGDDPAHAGG